MVYMLKDYMLVERCEEEKKIDYEDKEDETAILYLKAFSILVVVDPRVTPIQAVATHQN